MSVLVSTIAVFIFLVSAYRYLTNADLTFREVLPGAIVATIALEELPGAAVLGSRSSHRRSQVAGPISC